MIALAKAARRANLILRASREGCKHESQDSRRRTKIYKDSALMTRAPVSPEARINPINP